MMMHCSRKYDCSGNGEKTEREEKRASSSTAAAAAAADAMRIKMKGDGKMLAPAP